MKDSQIQWCDHTWNLARGCTKVDADCKFCYMMRDGDRYTGPAIPRRVKTYVLMISKRFMAGHPKAGQRTFFKEKMMFGALHYEAKLHTIRGNYDYWKKVVDRVNAGEAVLSIREWKGKPYKSKQVEFLQVKTLGIQKIKTWIVASGRFMEEGIQLRRDVVVDEQNKLSQKDVFKLAYNDGLSSDDFNFWFGDKVFTGAIIHFSRLRYA